MIVSGIRTYTPIRQTQNFVGNGRKKRKVLFTKAELKALEDKLKELRNNPAFVRKLEEIHARDEAERQENRRRSIEELHKKLKEPITI